MATVDDVINWVKTLADKINNQKANKEIIKKWIKKNYWGKIISWKMDGKGFFLIITRDGEAKFGTGDYPSPEVTMLISPDAFMELLKKDPYTGLKGMLTTNQLVIRGNLNEANKFLGAVKEILK
ncbi:MAG: SCP2 sterol-binding domain-containing protein [Candidatus Helarchaeota archaeon]|nr:SCP2 sterol-binding domain-containing protein [Candidatus Helarchaeota archaeon]